MDCTADSCSSIGGMRLPSAMLLSLEEVCSFLFCRPVCKMVKQYSQHTPAIDEWQTYVESVGSNDFEVFGVFLDPRYLTNSRPASRSSVAERRFL